MVETSIRDVIDGRPIGRFQWAVAIMVTSVLIIDGIDLQLASYSAPMLMKAWHLGKPQFAPLLAAALIGSAVGTLIGSWVGDRYGRRPTLVASVAFFGVMTLLCSSANTPAHFMVLRFGSGLGFGAVFPVATAMMSEWMPRRAAGKAISIMTVGIPVGGMIGAAGSVWLLPSFGWRYLFIGTGALCILFSVVLLWQLPESPSFLLLKQHYGKARALFAKAWEQPVAHDVVLSHVATEIAVTSGLFSRANIRVNAGLWLGVLSISFAAYAVGGWLTVILVDLHLPLATALRGPLVVGLCGVAGGLTVGWLIARFGTRLVMSALSILAFTAAITMCIATRNLEPGRELFTTLFFGLAIGGFCSGALLPTFYVVAARAYETRTRSRGVGAAAVTGRIGAIFSSFAGGAVLAVGQASGFFALIAVLAIGALCGIFLIDRHIQPLRRDEDMSGSLRQA